MIPFIIHYAVIALGIGYVTYLGMDIAIDSGISFLTSRYDALPIELVQIVEVMGVPDALVYITTAASSAIAIKLTVGLTRMVANRPAGLV